MNNIIAMIAIVRLIQYITYLINLARNYSIIYQKQQPQSTHPLPHITQLHMSLSKANVRKAIYQQQINGEKIYYSFVNKSQQTLSMMKNQRLLIFNTKSGHLYYINQPKALPFGNQMPKPKNIVADMNLTSVVKQLPGTTQLYVQFLQSKDKNQTIEWNFICENADLCAAWLKVIQQYKEMKNKEKNEGTKLKEDNKNITVSPKKDDISQPKENPFLGYRAESNIEKSKPPLQNRIQPKPQIEKQKPSPPPLGNISQSNVQSNKGLGESRQSISPQKSIINQSINQMGDSKNSLNKGVENPNQLRQSGTTKPTVNLLQPNKSNLGSSQSKPILTPAYGSHQGSSIQRPPLLPSQQSKTRPLGVQLRQQNQPRRQLGTGTQLQRQKQQNSRLTYKDQIEAMISTSKIKRSGINNNSSIRNKSQPQQIEYNRKNDWNYRFYNNPTQQVLLQFQQYSVQSFFSIIEQDRHSSQPLRVYLQPQSLIIVTDFGSVEAKKIKSQFRNYHFIMESLKNVEFGTVVGVPLSCLIQYEGLVIMVKSLIPATAPKLQFTQDLMIQLKDLQRYTRIKNNILKKSTIYDLSHAYQSRGRRLLYINQLIEYLPIHIQESFFGSSLRPQHLLDNVSQFMHGGMAYEASRQDMKVMGDVINEVRKNVGELAKELSAQDVKVANGIQLKDIMHSRGINLKYLPVLYNQTTNKLVKKYIHSFMVAKIVKDDISQNLSQTRKERADSTNPQQQVKDLIEKSIKFIIQGNSNVSNQLWKEIAIKFRQKYNITMSNHDIMGTFFLSCLMGLLKGDFDLTKVNLKKVFFKDENVLGKGFVREIGIKVKSYYRWMSESAERLMQAVKKEGRDYDEFCAIVEGLELEEKAIPQWLQLSNSQHLLYEYMTHFSPPNDFQPESFSHIPLYASVAIQPPTTSSLLITKNYLKWCLQFGQYPTFKSLIDSTLHLIDLWLSPTASTGGNIYHCQFYQLLAKYYEQQGAIDDGINFLKESLAVSIRNGGLAGKKIGDRYFALADMEMRKGAWQDSMDNFLKAKNNMQNSKNTQQLRYPLTLMKLSQLYLNSSQFENCLSHAKQSLEDFQKLQSINKKDASSAKGQYGQHCIKLIQIMARAFQIQNKKNQLYRVAQLSATKYNRTPNQKVYQRLIKICLTAVIMKHSLQKSKMLQSLVEKIFGTASGQQADSLQRDLQKSLNELMSMSSQINVMQKFMVKYESLQRIVTDINGRRAVGNDGKEFMNLVRNIVNVVGEEFLYGLVQQREVDE